MFQVWGATTRKLLRGVTIMRSRSTWQDHVYAVGRTKPGAEGDECDRYTVQTSRKYGSTDHQLPHMIINKNNAKE